MKDLKGRVAVITGAASGIGRGIAERCAAEGMKIVLADIEESALDETEAKLKSEGADVVALRVNVSKLSDVERMARKTLEVYGRVDLLCNNAGVGFGNAIWEDTVTDLEWVVGVNLWGVIYGLKVFVPVMLAQDTDCHIVNTASMAGLLSSHPSAVYQLTKHAVVGLSENLYHSLAQRGAKVRVSVLCPGPVNTRILEAERNRPPELKSPVAERSVTPSDEVLDLLRPLLEKGLSPNDVADLVFRAINEEKFYVLTHPAWNPMIQTRVESILLGRNPVAEVFPS